MSETFSERGIKDMFGLEIVLDFEEGALKLAYNNKRKFGETNRNCVERQLDEYFARRNLEDDGVDVVAEICEHNQLSQRYCKSL